MFKSFSLKNTKTNTMNLSWSFFFNIFLSNIYINSLELCSYANGNNPIQDGGSGGGGYGRGVAHLHYKI